MTGDTRERILEIAARLFHTDGFAATGVATVLRAAGVKSGSLYHFFASKDALLVAVLERHLRLLDATVLGPAANAEDDPIQRVFALLAQYRRDLETTGYTKGCPVGNLALEVGDHMPEARAVIDGYFRSWTEGVREWLEQAGDRLPRDLDREACARLIHAVMEGGVMQARAHGGAEPFDAAVAQLQAYVDALEERATRERRGEQGGAGEESREPGVRPHREGPGWKAW